MLPEIRIQGSVPSIAHLDQYAGVWAIEETRAQFLIQKANSLNLTSHIEANQEETAAAATNFGFQTYTGQSGGNVAVVSISGVMTKYGSSFSHEGSTIRARKALRNAIDDPSIASVLALWETPGGTVAGTKELADDIAAASKEKPLWSYCNDLCASAGYWGASHASKVYANEMSVVGSIGTFMVIHDYSQMFQDEGVKVQVIRAGDFKGAGTMGTEVSAEHISEWQSRVDQLNQFFTAGVKKHRGFSAKQINDLADGRVYIGKTAVDLGLIDGVQSLDKTLAALSKQKTPSGASASVPEQIQSEESPKMTNETSTPAADSPKTPVAATYKEIVQACQGCDPKANADDAQFVADCQEQEMTVSQSQSHWMQTLNARIESRDAEVKAAQDTASQGKGKSKGLSSLNDGSSESNGSATASGDPIADWNAIVSENMKACGNNRQAAMRMAVVNNPEAHEAYLAAYSAAHPSPESKMRRRGK